MKARLDSFAIFALFCGMGVLDAFQTHHWIRAAFWLIAGSMFLLPGAPRKRIW